MRSGLFEDGHPMAARFSCCAGGQPAGPEPMIRIFFPVRERGSQAGSNPLACIIHDVRSITLKATGGSWMRAQHAASQGRRADRPVNSEVVGGVQERMASCQVLVNEIIPVGMMLLSGRPVCEKGTPQSMHGAWCGQLRRGRADRPEVVVDALSRATLGRFAVY